MEVKRTMRRRRNERACRTRKLETSFNVLASMMLFIMNGSTSVWAQRPVLPASGRNSVDLGLHSSDEGEWGHNFLLHEIQQRLEWKTQQDRYPRNLRRYDHYKTGSAYEYEKSRNRPPSFSTLSDIWLCLACALGWSVWLVSATRSQNPLETASVFESHESKTVHGHVLQVTLGEDADGTGIPIYHTLVDYVVGSENPDDEPLQVRKCFSTRKLLEEGFANVEVLVLVDDPTTSILVDDFVQSQTERVKQQMEPPSMMWSAGVYVAAAILIITSLVGGVHAVIKLHPEQVLAGKISLGVGIVLLYPAAMLVYKIINFFNRWSGPLHERPGVIIHGARDYWKRKCGATLNPLEVMGTFDEGVGNSGSINQMPSSPQVTQVKEVPVDTSMGTHVRSHRKADLDGNMESAYMNGLELPEMKSSDKADSKDDKEMPLSPRFPNAGCGFGNFNVNVPKPDAGSVSDATDDMGTKGYDLSTISVSSMSSATGGNHSNDSSTVDNGKKVHSLKKGNSEHQSLVASAFAALQFPNILGGITTPPPASSPKTTSDTEGVEPYAPPMMLQEAYSSEKYNSQQNWPLTISHSDRSSIATKQANNRAESAKVMPGVGMSRSSSGSFHSRVPRASTPSSHVAIESLAEVEEEAFSEVGDD